MFLRYNSRAVLLADLFLEYVRTILHLALVTNEGRLPPGTDADGWWTVLRSGLWRMHYMLSAEGRKRYFDELLPLLHQTKLEVMGPRDADCYYLVYLGTKPKARGRGYARTLIEDMIRVVSLSFRFPVIFLSSLESKARTSLARV